MALLIRPVDLVGGAKCLKVADASVGPGDVGGVDVGSGPATNRTLAGSQLNGRDS